jgi:hypothetical protein
MDDEEKLIRFKWDDDKNDWLKENRSISYEEIVEAIRQKKIVDIIRNPNQERYKGQLCLFVNVDDYIYVVPAILDVARNELFLKTIYPSRKQTKKYLRG